MRHTVEYDDAELDQLILDLRAVQAERKRTAGGAGGVLLDETWKTLDAWGQGMNGAASAALVPSGVQLSIADAHNIPHGTGSRLFHIHADGQWWPLVNGQTVTMTYPLTIPELFAVDQGADAFMTMGIQGKDDPALNALWATNVETINGELVAWVWHRDKGVIKRAGFPAYVIGSPNACTIKVHVAPDDTGWLEFALNGQTLRVEGATCGANGVAFGPVCYSNAVDHAQIVLGELVVKM